MEVPLILTLAMEEKAFQFFNSLRKIYFPLQENFIDAHLTIFHFLPNEPVVINAIENICKEQKQFLLEVTEPAFTDNGVAYQIKCDELIQMHNVLQRQWHSFLIPQDMQILSPHVTVQNNVSSEEAKQLHQFLKDNFCGFKTTGIALQLWEYGGGKLKLFRQFELLNP